MKISVYTEFFALPYRSRRENVKVGEVLRIFNYRQGFRLGKVTNFSFRFGIVGIIVKRFRLQNPEKTI